MDDELSCDAFLGGQLNIWQPRHGYRAGSDPVFLAAACEASAGQSVLEFGSGVGVASLCLARRVTGLSVTGIELQADYADLARRNAQENALDIDIITGDLVDAAALTHGQDFDHVIMNPPFFAPGVKSVDAGRDMAMHNYGGLKPWIRSGLARVRPLGYLTIIHRVERLADILALLNSKAAGFEIKPLAARVNRPPKLAVIRARKGSRAGTRLCNPLIIHDGTSHDRDRDDHSQDARLILRDGGALTFY